MKKNVVVAVVLGVLLMGYGLPGVTQASMSRDFLGDGGSGEHYRNHQNDARGEHNVANVSFSGDYHAVGFSERHHGGAPQWGGVNVDFDSLYTLEWLIGLRDQLQLLLERLDSIIAEIDDDPSTPGNAVPVPGAALLLGSAMAALAGLRRCRK